MQDVTSSGGVGEVPTAAAGPIGEARRAVLCHHLKQHDRYPPALHHKLRAASATSLAQLPAEPLQAAISEMDVDRATSLRSLLEAA